MERWAEVLYTIEWFFTLLFTAEYLLRLWTVSSPINYSRSFLLFNAPLHCHDESHRFVNVKHIFFKCYFGAIWKGLSQYPHSVKDKCCDLGRGVWVSRWLFMRFSVPKHPPFDPGGITTCFRIIMTSMVWVINLFVFVSNHCIDA